MIRRPWLLLVFAAAACDRPSSSSGARPDAAARVPAPSLSAAAAALPSTGDAASDAPAGGAVVRFDAEVTGAPPASFEPVVGDWLIADVAGAKGLEVDGARWRSGTPSANLADQAKRLYGDRYAEFLDGVKAFAFYPLAIAKEAPPAGDLKVSVRFYPIAGKIDQAAGIAFGARSDGSYWGVRANALEDNILFFKVVKGKRTILDTVRSVPTPTRTWHTLAVTIRGEELRVVLDGAERFSKKLDAPPVGRVGLWSKADSQVLFDDFEVTTP